MSTWILGYRHIDVSFLADMTGDLCDARHMDGWGRPHRCIRLPRHTGRHLAVNLRCLYPVAVWSDPAPLRHIDRHIADLIEETREPECEDLHETLIDGVPAKRSAEKLGLVDDGTEDTEGWSDVAKADLEVVSALRRHQEAAETRRRLAEDHAGWRA